MAAVDRLPVAGAQAVVTGRVVFRSGSTAPGVRLRVESSACEHHSIGQSDADGGFTIALQTTRIRDVTIACEIPGAEPLRFLGDETAEWDVGDVVVPDSARLDLEIVLDAEGQEPIGIVGGRFLVRVTEADARPRRGLLERDVPAAEAFGWRASQWLPIVPAVEVDWGWQAAHATLPTWIERIRLPRMAATNSYGASRLVLDARRWLRGSVVAEGGQVVAAATVRATCTPLQGRARLLITRTDAAGRFCFVIPAEASVVLQAQVGQRKSGEVTLRGGQEVILPISLVNHVRLRLVDGDVAVPRFYMGRFHVEDRSGETAAREVFVREYPDGVVDLGVERVAAGERWVFHAAGLGARLWFAPTDIHGGGAPVEVRVEQMQAAVPLLVRLGPEVRSRCAGGAEIVLTERRAVQPLRHRASVATDGMDTRVDQVFALEFDYEIRSGGVVVASGIFDARGGAATLELAVP